MVNQTPYSNMLYFVAFNLKLDQTNVKTYLLRNIVTNLINEDRVGSTAVSPPLSSLHSSLRSLHFPSLPSPILGVCVFRRNVF